MSKDKIELSVINIYWEKVAIAAINTLHEKHDFGVYQLYGHHPAYGDDALLYIGQAKDQNFETRISQHENAYTFVESTCRPTFYRIGRIMEGKDAPKYPEYDADWRSDIDIAESILIIAHPPAFNQTLVKSFWKEGLEKYIVINWGDFGRIQSDVTLLRRSLWEHDTFKGLEV